MKTHIRKIKEIFQFHPRQRGVAIILSLVFIALLSILVVEFLYESEVEASLAYSQQGELEAYLAAKSAVAKGIAFLAEDTLNTMMSGAPPIDSDFDLMTFNMGASMEPLNNALMHAYISDEYGKINLNALLMPQSGGEPQERTPLVNALREFFMLRDTGEGAAPDIIVDSILDWLDYNDGDSERPQGAENDYYMGLENPYPCKNGPMDSIEELLLIKGITPKIYFGDPEKEQLPLSEYLTVHGDWLGRVNINSARPEVISAIVAGYTGNPADLGIGQRIYDDAHIQPFTDLNQLSSYGISPRGPVQQTNKTNNSKQAQRQVTPNIMPSQPNNRLAQQYAMGGQYFTLKSDIFRIYGDGLYQNRMVRIEAYVFRNPMGYEEGISPGTNMNPVNQRTNQKQNVKTNTQGNRSSSSVVSQNQTGLPAEPFRILDWKIIK
ncbi:MAG TPA: type II secretion system protein GspK [Candidatus Hydrogenedens sp.]|nr:general secretion pathway protein GspK [Candidatus Hydrogenedens sp.]HOK08419.1 type II secretion system protein GspK [Candidatus Hydrogenedens sp.]HOL19450.1 type II secretion system protein GspK [Candidatus Hydrogenedens sp.]HPP58168.1 type II secretion system protein GspK [Candidatus Hydrogenedens sp.]